VTQVIACAERKVYFPGEDITREGDKSSSMYVVHGGEVVATRRQREICVFTVGDTFCATAMLGVSKVHTHTYCTKRMSHIIVVTRRTFLDAMEFWDLKGSQWHRECVWKQQQESNTQAITYATIEKQLARKERIASLAALTGLAMAPGRQMLPVCLLAWKDHIIQTKALVRNGWKPALDPKAVRILGQFKDMGKKASQGARAFGSLRPQRSEVSTWRRSRLPQSREPFLDLMGRTLSEEENSAAGCSNKQAAVVADPTVELRQLQKYLRCTDAKSLYASPPSEDLRIPFTDVKSPHKSWDRGTSKEGCVLPDRIVGGSGTPRQPKLPRSPARCGTRCKASAALRTQVAESRAESRSSSTPASCGRLPALC